MRIDWIYLIGFFISMGIALLATPVVKWVALKFEKFDSLSARKVHQRPMVRLGGVAIVGATVASILSLWAIDATGFLNETIFSVSLSSVLLSSSSMPLASMPFVSTPFVSAPFVSMPFASMPTVALLLVGGSGFFLIGFADDIFELSAFHRLWMQGAIASLVWSGGVRIEALMLPGLADEPMSLGWLSLPVTVLWLAGVVNAINWMDGLDGLAAGVASVAALVIVAIGVTMAQPVPALVGSALLGGLLGFLYYNYYPAKIFMGDGGSYFIGFMLAGLCIVGPMQLESNFATLLPLVILAVPLGDMTGVIAARLYRGCSPFSADNRHLHHRLLAMSLTHRMAVWVLYAGMLVAGAIALVLAGVAYSWVLVVGAIAALLVLLWAQLRRAARFQLSDDVVVTKEELWCSKNL